MKSYREDAERRLAAEQAASWLTELAEPTTAKRRAFVAWLRRSPRHVGEFLAVSASWKAFEPVTGHDPRAIDKIVAEALAQETPDNVIPFQDALPSKTPDRAPQGRGMMRMAALVAAVAIVGALGLGEAMRRGALGAHLYATDIGEQRSFRLEDGSVLHLNTASKVRVEYSAQARTVRLLEGEGLFTVAHDPSRPFRVMTDRVVIQALGTQFDVYRHEDATTVSVAEGAVRISGTAPMELTAGEQADVESGGRALKRAKADVQDALAWRERRLVFQDERLERIAAEVNRYTPHHIRVTGDTARNTRITGTFNADDPQSLALFLNKVDGLSVQSEGGGYVIRAR